MTCIVYIYSTIYSLVTKQTKGATALVFLTSSPSSPSTSLLSLLTPLSQDFEHYYEGISIETANDTEFYSLLKNCWTV